MNRPKHQSRSASPQHRSDEPKKNPKGWLFLLALGLIGGSVWIELVALSPLNPPAFPPVSGGVVLESADPKDRPNLRPPVFIYSSDIGGQDILQVILFAHRSGGAVRIVFSDISTDVSQPCVVEDHSKTPGTSVPFDGFRFLTRDTTVAGEGIAHSDRALYIANYNLRPDTLVYVTCQVADAPERRSFSGREIDFLVPFRHEVYDQLPGLEPVSSEVVALRSGRDTEFQDASGRTRTVASDRVANIAGGYTLSTMDPLLRVTWVDVQDATLGEFLQFAVGVLLAFGAGILIELVFR